MYDVCLAYSPLIVRCITPNNLGIWGVRHVRVPEVHNRAHCGPGPECTDGWPSVMIHL